MDELKRFRQLGSKTAGHPEYGHAAGIETTTGPLGQGLGNAVGMALAERLLNARLGDAIVDHYTYVIAGDGCLMEGISHEAISLAGHLRLNKLIVLFDDNSISIDGPTSLAVSDDQVDALRGRGLGDAERVDGHDPEAIAGGARGGAALGQADADRLQDHHRLRRADQGRARPPTHGEPLGAEEIKGARDKLGWPHRALRGAGRRAGGLARRGRAARRAAQGLGEAPGKPRRRAASAVEHRRARRRSASAGHRGRQEGEFAADAAQDRHPRLRRRRCWRSWCRRCPR